MKRGNIRKFGREHVQRQALLKSLATALIDHGQIKTSQAKAKTLSMYMGKLITKAKHNDVATRRLLAQDLGPKAVKKLVNDIAPKLQTRAGGYTRTYNLGQRRSDGAPMYLIEFVS